MGKKEKITPNILWITTDQQRYDTIGALGNKYIRTPNLDKLCREGVAFNRAYCQSPVCTPSRASFLTGLYPSTIHVNTNGNEYFPDNVRLITRELADIGYDCGLVGKLHLASAWKGVEKRTNDGYRVFHYNHAPGHGIKYGNEYVDWLMEKGVDLDEIFITDDDHDYYWYSPEAPAEFRQTAWCGEKAIEFIEREGTSPWCLNVNFFDPHAPFDAPKTYKEHYPIETLPGALFTEGDLELQKKLKKAYHNTTEPKNWGSELVDIKASYYGMIEMIDEQVGRIIEALEKSGQRENTIIIFMSDHGEMLGDHGLILKGCRFYEGAVRVPLIISWKGAFKEGIVVDDIVELTDIAPTIADLCSISLKACHGKSLLPFLYGDTSYRNHRSFVRCEYYDAVNIYAPYEPEKHIPTYATMYMDGRYKLVVYHGIETGELYDLHNDPNEFINLWDEYKFNNIKIDLLKKSFDESIKITDPGAPIIGRY